VDGVGDAGTTPAAVVHIV
jgi:hypothetical protein